MKRPYNRVTVWDDFRSGTNGSYAIPSDVWESCNGDVACQEALEAKYKAEAIETAERFRAEVLKEAP